MVHASLQRHPLPLTVLSAFRTEILHCRVGLYIINCIGTRVPLAILFSLRLKQIVRLFFFKYQQAIGYVRIFSRAFFESIYTKGTMTVVMLGGVG